MTEKNYETLKLENQLCFPLYACSRQIIKKYHKYLDELNLTYTQYIAMMVFWEVKKINVKDLGKRLYLDSGTLTPLLKNLEEKGFVHRYRSKEDERVLLVEITESGEALKEQAVNIPAKMNGCMNLTPEEAMTLYQLLYKTLAE
ncbi:MAG: MarR family transcriptional regulator [Oscillospiraceae bacterium]|nr:MarR family transcriptional regulator [Oscillospiraceae bacterium]